MYGAVKTCRLTPTKESNEQTNESIQAYIELAGRYA